MKKRKWIVQVLFTLISFICLTGCMKKKDVASAPYKIYYLNPEQTGLVEEAYTGETEEPEKAAEEILTCLKEGSEGIQGQSVIPDGVEIERFTLDNEKLDLYFNSSYHDMNTVQEVLCRAALVRSLTQINEIDLVGFHVDGEPLTNDEGKEYGYFQSEDFVQNTGQSFHSFEETNLVLYFANEDGTRLCAVKRNVVYSSNISMERLVVEQLLLGPQKNETGYAVLNPSTKILSVTVKDGTCYVNLDTSFWTKSYNVSSDVMIYSIVNSLTELSSVNRVQITIDTEGAVDLKDHASLQPSYERNLDLVE